MKNLYKAGFYIGRCFAVIFSLPIFLVGLASSLLFVAMSTFIEGFTHAMEISKEERERAEIGFTMVACVVMVSVVFYFIPPLVDGTAGPEKQYWDQQRRRQSGWAE